MELKYRDNYEVIPKKVCSNRTFMELKLATITSLLLQT